MVFRHRKKENREKGKKRIWDKVLMGAVIGGAIGSVLGASIAPQKGKKTRKEIEHIAKNAKNSSRIFFKRFGRMLGLGKKGKKIPTEEE